jgi:hypothetical protein
MILLLHEDLSNLFRHRLLSKRFTLRNAFAVIANGLVFIIEIKPSMSFAFLDVRTGLGVTTGILPR